MKAAIYIRVSTLKQAEQGFGLDAQLSKCHLTCQLKGYQLTQIYRDEGVSGTTPIEQREGFSKLMKHAEKGKFNVLVFYCFDRLARSIRVLLNTVDKLKALNIEIVSCKENIDTSTDQGDFMMNIYASVSQLELKTIKTRMASGKDEKRKQFGYVGGRLPYGYSLVDKTIEPNSFIDNVKRIFTLRSMGHSYRSICKILNEMGIPSPTNGLWNPSSVMFIVKNKHKYEGGIINNNENDIRWPKVLP